MPELIRDVFEPVQFVIEESNDIVDGQHVLGKLKGEFFVPDGISRNKRFYGKNVWEKQLQNEDVKTKLAERRMYGTIGHKIPINDESLAEGKISHMTTSLAIDSNGKGVGEALILGTPVGRILNTVLRAGSKLYVSSRANGDYRGTSHGVPSVDPDSFHLEGFDFVLEPGFLQANPALVESLQKDVKELLELVEVKPVGEVKSESPKINEKKEEEKLTEENKEYVKEVLGMKELVEALTKEKMTLTEELGKALKSLNEIKAEKEALSAEVASMQKTLVDTKEKASKSELYEKLGSPEEVEKALDLAEKVIWKYKQSGSPDEVGKALDQAYEQLKQLKKYRELGSPEEISTAFDKAEALIVQYRKLGTIAELNEALDTATKMFKRFQDLGSPSEIALALDKSSKLIENIKAGNFKKRVESLSTELGIPLSKITELAKKMTDGEIRSFVKTLTESNKLKDKYLVNPKDGKGGKKDHSKKEGVDDSAKPSIFTKTLGQNLMENFSK